jgi:4-hydroxybenzoate polyprenyltransferase
MVWNDWVDRDIDANVQRTKDRPLALGRLKTSEVMAWMVVQFGTAWAILYWMLDGHNM